jgi:hypothetical protein
MNRKERLLAACRVLATRAVLIAASAYFWLLMSPVALAAKKKAHVQEVDQGKGYTLSYMFVIAVLSLGLMAVLRPGRRLENVDEQIKKKDSE